MDEQEILDLSRYLQSCVEFGRFTEIAVTAALVALAKTPKGEYEQPMPDVGGLDALIEKQAMKERIAHDREMRGLPSREEQEQQANDARKRLLAEVRQREMERDRQAREEREQGITGPSVSDAEMIAKLDAALPKMPVTSKKPTAPTQASTAQPQATLRDMTIDETKGVFDIIDTLNAMSETGRGIAYRALLSTKSKDDLASLRRALRMYFPGVDPKENEPDERTH